MQIPTQRFVSVLSDVLFPTAAKIQEDKARFQRLFLKSMSLIAFLTLPLCILLVIIAPELIVGLYGEKWSGAILPFQILGLFGVFRGMYNASAAFLRAKGFVYQILIAQIVYGTVMLVGVYYKILLDSNITVPEHFLEAGIQQLEENNSDFGAPLIKYEVDENSTTWELLDSLVYVNIEGEIKSGSVTGGCVFTKNDFFNRFGYFDESLRSTGDTLWSQKATSMGAKLFLLEKLEVNYPPKDKHMLLKKARRIGAGNRSVWHQEELPSFRMFLKAIRSMQPLSFSVLRRIIEKRGRNDIVYPHLKLWFYNWIRNINTGIGRLGF